MLQTRGGRGAATLTAAVCSRRLDAIIKQGAWPSTGWEGGSHN